MRRPHYPFVALFGCILLVDMSHLMHMYKSALSLAQLCALVLDDNPDCLKPLLSDFILLCYSHGVRVSFALRRTTPPSRYGRKRMPLLMCLGRRLWLPYAGAGGVESFGRLTLMLCGSCSGGLSGCSMPLWRLPTSSVPLAAWLRKWTRSS